MTKDEIRFQVATSCIQGVLEAKHGVIGEIVPSVAVAESLRIADEFVRQWSKTSPLDEIKEDVEGEVEKIEPTIKELIGWCEHDEEMLNEVSRCILERHTITSAFGPPGTFLDPPELSWLRELYGRLEQKANYNTEKKEEQA